MLENIDLTKAPQECGVYFFKDKNDVVIYVGSSKNLYNRMKKHRADIKKGNCHGGKQDFYQFLRSNQFNVEFQLSDDYIQLEQKLIEKHRPKYNEKRADVNIPFNGNTSKYHRVYYQKYKEDFKQYSELHKNEILEKAKRYRESHKEKIKQYRDSHKEERKQYYESHKEETLEKAKQEYSQLCSYNGETLTLRALSLRFLRKGIRHPVLEAKKYLVVTN